MSDMGVSRLLLGVRRSCEPLYAEANAVLWAWSMDSWPSAGAERGASGGGEVIVISLLKPDAVRLPLAGRDCLGLAAGADGFDCGEGCLTGDSDGDSKELISMTEKVPARRQYGSDIIRKAKKKIDGPR